MTTGRRPYFARIRPCCKYKVSTSSGLRDQCRRQWLLRRNQFLKLTASLLPVDVDGRQARAGGKRDISLGPFQPPAPDLGRVVAGVLEPPRVRGCLPGDPQSFLPQLQAGPPPVCTIEWHGKIRQCIREYASAASSFSFTWKPLDRCRRIGYKEDVGYSSMRPLTSAPPSPAGFSFCARNSKKRDAADRYHPPAVTALSTIF